MVKKKVNSVNISVQSERYSMSGWDIKELLKRNLKNLKELSKWVISIIPSIALFKQNPALIFGVTIGLKIGLDSLEYYLRKQE